MCGLISGVGVCLSQREHRDQESLQLGCTSCAFFSFCLHSCQHPLCARQGQLVRQSMGGWQLKREEGSVDVSNFGVFVLQDKC